MTDSGERTEDGPDGRKPKESTPGGPDENERMERTFTNTFEVEDFSGIGHESRQVRLEDVVEHAPDGIADLFRNDDGEIEPETDAKGDKVLENDKGDRLRHELRGDSMQLAVEHTYQVDSAQNVQAAQNEARYRTHGIHIGIERGYDRLREEARTPLGRAIDAAKSAKERVQHTAGVLGDRVSGVLAGGDDGTDEDPRGPMGRRGAKGKEPDWRKRESGEHVYTEESAENETAEGKIDEANGEDEAHGSP